MKKKSIKLIGILKNLTGSVWFRFHMLKAEKTKPNQTQTEKTEPNREKIESNQKNKAKPV